MKAKYCAFGTEKTDFVKLLRKLTIFDQNLSKIDFFYIFTKFLLGFLPLLRKCYLWQITPDFYNNFFRYRGGGHSPCSPLRHWYFFVPWEFAKKCKRSSKASLIKMKFRKRKEFYSINNNILNWFILHTCHFKAKPCNSFSIPQWECC